MHKLLQKLTISDAPPGRENEVRDIVVQELKSITDELTIDELGNVIGKRTGENEKNFMLIAHQDDDWALIVSHIDEQGFLRFRRLVGHRWNLLGQRVTIHGRFGKRTGVIGLPAPHLIPVDVQKRGYQPDEDTMFIDCGASSRADAKALGLEVGQFITAHKHFEELPNERLIGNCFDNRVGITVMIETMRRIRTLTPAISVTAVASVQEELGARGAQPAAFKVQPDYAIALDVAPTGDHPKIKSETVPVRLRDGPVLLIADKFGISSRQFNTWLEGVAEAHNVPLQHVVLRTPIHFGTDASAVQLARKGTTVTAVLVPTRYFHTTNSIVDYSDLERTVTLLVASINSLGELTRNP
ncbi:MAG: M42 family metallopeptidase [Promethearchaeota archaeon]